MIINVNFQMFTDQFVNMGRADQFSYEALEYLFDHYNEIEDATGQHVECDVIAICCEWLQVTIDEAADMIGEQYNSNDWDSKEEWEEFIIGALEYETTIHQLDGGNILVREF